MGLGGVAGDYLRGPDEHLLPEARGGRDGAVSDGVFLLGCVGMTARPKHPAIEIKYVPVSDLKPAPYNPRTITDNEMKRLKTSMREFGVVDPLVVNATTGFVVGGNQRLEAARQLGIKALPVVEVRISRKREKALNLALNKISGDWDMPLLKDLLQDLDTGEFDMELTGFDEQEIEDLMTQFNVEQEIEEDEAPPVPEKATCKPGDLWILGEHRLLCGDATKKMDVERLMDGAKADMGLTSPPYFVGKEYETDTSFNEHLQLLRDIADRSLEAIKPGGFFFINFDDIGAQSHASPMTGSSRQCVYFISKDYWQIFHEERGMDLYAQRIWYKPFNRLQKPFWTYKTSIPHYQEWEHIWTWRLPGGNKDRVYDWAISVRAIWDTREEATDDRPLTRHIAAFPICLPERALKAHSEKGNLIWEPFSGSGTTIVASELLNRQCYAMEIAPEYCDVSIIRWQNLTGRNAIREDGKTWDELKSASSA